MAAFPEKRALPPETIDALRPPRIGFPYFLHAEQFPFQSQATDFSAVNAWWLADAALLVYGDADFVESALDASPLVRMGYRLGWLGTRTENRGIVLDGPEALILVFRGTRVQAHTLLDAAEIVFLNQNDLWTDSQFLPARAAVGGRVHAGFLKAFSEVQGQVDQLVRGRRPGQAVWLAGHSLGGALATLAAAHLGADAVQGLYTYGAPRVGNSGLTPALPQRSFFRFVHRDDLVTTVPPDWLGYVHAGISHVLRGDAPRSLWKDFTQGAAELASAAQRMAKALRLDMGSLPFKVGGLADHAPVYYATLLWNELLEST
ncbi:MAG: lipase family protein [Planctomycetales bacterium]